MLDAPLSHPVIRGQAHAKFVFGATAGSAEGDAYRRKIDTAMKAARCKIATDSLPLSHCLIFRRNTLIMLETINFLDVYRQPYVARRTRRTFGSVACRAAHAVSDRAMKLIFEDDYYDAFRTA